MTDITLWHTVGACAPEEFNRFINKDIHTKRNLGMGGQSGGLFVWADKASAKGYIDFLENELWQETQEGQHRYAVGLSVDKEDVYYPKWQLDTEAFAPVLFPLIAAERELLEEIQTMSFIQNEQGDKGRICQVRVSASDGGGGETLLVMQKGLNGVETFKKYRSFSAENSGLVQALSDYLYDYSDAYKEAYDSLLQKAVSGKEINYQDSRSGKLYEVDKAALKYTGTQKMNVCHIEKCINGTFNTLPVPEMSGGLQVEAFKKALVAER